MTFVERQAEHLVEIAVVDKALPVHTQESAAHHAVEVRLLIGVAQQRHVFVEPTLRDEHAAEALDRHVGQCVESVEHDPVARMELALVVRLESALGWRQARALGVVDKI